MPSQLTARLLAARVPLQLAMAATFNATITLGYLDWDSKTTSTVNLCVAAWLIVAETIIAPKSLKANAIDLATSMKRGNKLV